MKHLVQKILFSISAVLLAWMSFEEKAEAKTAEYESIITQAEGFGKPERLFDEDRGTYTTAKEDACITLSYEEGIQSIYIEFDRIPGNWILTDAESGETVNCGNYGFLHEYVDVAAMFGREPEALPRELKLTFEEGTVIADVYGFTEGELPDFVQLWQPPCEEADLLLFSSHSDDEQLFFLGMLPLYAGEKGLQVQVAYVVQHFEVNKTQNHVRPHEQLDGLWTVGVRNYPVMSEFPDLYAESKDRETALTQTKKVYENAGYTYEDFLDYSVGCIRRFKPLVVVSHDLDGEYGHGTHVLCAAALTEAIGYAADETYVIQEKDTVPWQIEKLYLHLYEENPIVMDYDIPLEHFGGKTAFEVSGEGFDCHKSQHWTWFYKWRYGTEARPIQKATDIRSYSPCKFGLYYTSVGQDVACNDFFENVKTYGMRYEEQARIEAEKEAQRLKEEAEREALKKAALEKTEKEKAEAAELQKKLEAEEQSREALEKAELERENKQKLIYGALLLCVIAGIAISILIWRRRKH